MPCNLQELEPALVISQANTVIEHEKAKSSTASQDPDHVSPNPQRTRAIEFLSLLLSNVAEDPDWMCQPVVQAFLEGLVTSDAHLPRILKFYLAVISLINDAINDDIVPKYAFRAWANELFPDEPLQSLRMEPNMSAATTSALTSPISPTTPQNMDQASLTAAAAAARVDTTNAHQKSACMKTLSPAVSASNGQQALWDKTWNRLSSKLSTANMK